MKKRKIHTSLFILLVSLVLLGGCSRTWNTLQSYAHQGWQTILRWDEDFRKNCW